MAFADFTFPEVQKDLNLEINEADLFSHLPAVPLREDFAVMLGEAATVALAINNEKVRRSEFLIAPVLLELRRLLRGAVGLFSGVPFDVDPERGLNGTCDFILTRAARQFILSAPLVTIVEAKNDNLLGGLGQCIAEMVAAQIFNERAGRPVAAVHGVVSTGSAWKFLRLEASTVTLDVKEYYIDNIGKVLGVLKHIIENA